MKKYTRISSGFIATGAFGSLENDTDVSLALNQKLERFLKKEKVKDFRIINTETVIWSGDDYTPAYNIVCLHIEYEG